MGGVCACVNAAFMERSDPDSAFPLYIYRTDLHSFFCGANTPTEAAVARCTYRQSMDISDIIVTPVNVLATFVPPTGTRRCLLLACGMRCARF
jgi:hypothetical protein